MARFADEFSVDEIRAQPVPKIPWSTIIAIMNKSKSHEEMLWYINQTHKNGWSRSMVLDQFELKAYERSLIEPNTSTPIKSDDLTKEFSINEIGSQVATQIPWFTNYLNIKLKNRLK